MRYRKREKRVEVPIEYNNVVLLIEQGLKVEQFAPLQQRPHELRIAGTEPGEPIAIPVFTGDGIKGIAHGFKTLIQTQGGSHPMSGKAFRQEGSCCCLSRAVDTFEDD